MCGASCCLPCSYKIITQPVTHLKFIYSVFNHAAHFQWACHLLCPNQATILCSVVQRERWTLHPGLFFSLRNSILMIQPRRELQNSVRNGSEHLVYSSCLWSFLCADGFPTKLKGTLSGVTHSSELGGRRQGTSTFLQNLQMGADSAAARSAFVFSSDSVPGHFFLVWWLLAV